MPDAGAGGVTGTEEADGRATVQSRPILGGVWNHEFDLRADRNGGRGMSEEPFEPRIVGFLCNWCSYTAADTAGVSRVAQPPNVDVVRVMCTGRVDPRLILKALSLGADGVLVSGCHPGQCHYQKGNLSARRRVMALKPFLDATGIGADRLRLAWVSASEAPQMVEVVTDFTEEVRRLGPSPLRKLQNED